MSELPIAPRTVSLREFFALSRLRPADVQRSFRWGRDDALQLLTDLDRATPEEADAEADEADVDAADADEAEAAADEAAAPFDETATMDAEAEDGIAAALSERHLYLGAVVLQRGADGAIEIFDGLQRSTTLTILIAVLRDLEPDDDARRVLHEMIEAPEGGYRLTLRERDATLARDVQAPNGTARMLRVTAHRAIGRRIQDVKNALRDELVKWRLERRRALADYLRNHALFTILETGDPNLARQMFVSINLYGKPLNAMEVLRGQLAAAAPSEREESEILAIWDQIQEALGEHRQGAPREDAARRASEAGKTEPVDALSPPEQFLKAFDVIERCAPQTARWATDFGEYARRLSEWRGPTELMARLRRASLGWRSLQRILYPRPYNASDALGHEIWRLRFLPWDEWRPIALLLWNRYFIEQKRAPTPAAAEKALDDARLRFARLNQRCMVLAAADLRASNRASLFAKAALTAKRGQDPTLSAGARGLPNGGTLFPTPAQRVKAERTLRGQIKDQTLARALARWLELASNSAENGPQILAGTVEHILPRNPTDETRDRIARAGQDYDALCYALGNLAVVSFAGNDKSGNQEVRSKRPILAKEAKTFVLVRDALADGAPNAEDKDWDAGDIQPRTERLRDLFWSSIKDVRAPS